MEQTNSNENLNQFEVEKCVEILNKIQSEVYRTNKVSKENQAVWSSVSLKLRMAGYKMKKKRYIDSHTFTRRVRWYAEKIKAVVKRKRNFKCDFIYTDTRPEGATENKNHLKGDCTTRALSYILRGEKTYLEIEKEQYHRAELKNQSKGLHWGDRRRKYHRNTHGIWDSILTDIGYRWLKIHFTANVSTMAWYLKDLIDYPIIAHSCNHATIIHNGTIRDTWDCRGSKVKGILIKFEDVERIEEFLYRFGNVTLVA